MDRQTDTVDRLTDRQNGQIDGFAAVHLTIYLSIFLLIYLFFCLSTHIWESTQNIYFKNLTTDCSTHTNTKNTQKKHILIFYSSDECVHSLDLRTSVAPGWSSPREVSSFPDRSMEMAQKSEPLGFRHISILFYHVLTSKHGNLSNKNCGLTRN